MTKSIEVIYNVYPDATRQSGVRSYAQLLESILSHNPLCNLKLITAETGNLERIPYGSKVLIHIGVNEGELFSFLRNTKSFRPDLKRFILSHDPPFFPLEKRSYLRILSKTRIGRGARRAINSLLGRYWEKQVICQTDHWITLSDCGAIALRKKLVSLGIHDPKVESMNLGLYLPGQEFKIRNHDSFVLGYFGYISPSKGIGHLIRVVYSLRDLMKSLNVKVFVAGNPDSDHSRNVLNQEIEYVKSLGIDSIVSFLEAPSDEQLPAFIQSLDLLVLPYLRPGSCSASGPLHWAWTFGVPVMASDSPYFCEKLKDSKAGIVAPIGDVESWSSLLAEFLTNRRVRHNIILNTNRMQSANSWDSISRRLEELVCW